MSSSLWEYLEDALGNTIPGNNGKIGFYFTEPEIIPQNAHGHYRYNMVGKGTMNDADEREKGVANTFREKGYEKAIHCWTPEEDARSLIEFRFLAMRAHAERLGLDHVKRLLVTGGASRNSSIVQVLSDVFGVPVYSSTSTSSSAALGAAYRALHGFHCAREGKYIPMHECLSIRKEVERKKAEIGAPDEVESEYLKLVCAPEDSAHKIYSLMLPHYKQLEDEIRQQVTQKGNV